MKTVCSVAVALDVRRRRTHAGLGTADAAPCRARAAEDFLAAVLYGNAWQAGTPLDPELLNRFGRLVASAVEPASDLHASTDYRRHAPGGLTRRGLAHVWNDHHGKGEQ